MKLECHIVRDLLPDYIEHIVNDKVNTEIKEHLDSCEECEAYYQNMIVSLPSLENTPPSGLIKCKKRIKLAFIITFIFIGVLVFGFATYIATNWVEKDKTININKYEEYLGSSGTHSGITMIQSDIFPDALPESAVVEDFLYYYYNPWDPCFLTYLVYTCDDEEYKKEIGRLNTIISSSEYVYGLTGFPDDLCAVSANYNGIIYAMTQESENRIIYVEITACNYFTDIDYQKLVDKKYLPYDFDMTPNNLTRREKMKSLPSN